MIEITLHQIMLVCGDMVRANCNGLITSLQTVS
jgi:hypothetical protein